MSEEKEKFEALINKLKNKNKFMLEDKKKSLVLIKNLKKENAFIIEDRKKSEVLINDLKKENEIYSVENGQLMLMHGKTRGEKCFLQKHYNDLNNKFVDINEKLERCLVEKLELLEILKRIEINYYELQLTTATLQRKEKTKKLKMFRF